MSAKSILELHNSEKGKDIVVVASGKSVDFVPLSFYEDKVVVGVNFCYDRVPCKYTVCHHHCVCQPIIDSKKTILVTSEAETCVLNSHFFGWNGPYWHYNNLQGEYYYFKHTNQGYTLIDLSKFDVPETITAGGTVVTEALHFAYYLGAKNIICVGLDGGKWDDEINYKDYPRPTNDDHMGNVRSQLIQIANHIRSKGVPVMSINPFIYFDFEGHKFTL